MFLAEAHNIAIWLRGRSLNGKGYIKKKYVGGKDNYFSSEAVFFLVRALIVPGIRQCLFHQSLTFVLLIFHQPFLDIPVPVIGDMTQIVCPDITWILQNRTANRKQ